jgi:hypothetical protein
MPPTQRSEVALMSKYIKIIDKNIKTMTGEDISKLYSGEFEEGEHDLTSLGVLRKGNDSLKDLMKET